MKRYITLFLLVFVLLFICFYNSEYLAEHLYLKGIFQGFRVIHDYSFGFLPIPSIYIAFLILFAYLGYSIKMALKKKSILTFLLSLLKSIFVLFVCFYLLWGFNYYKPNFRELIEFDFKEIPAFNINQVFEDQTKKLNTLVKAGLDESQYLELDYESTIRQEMELLFEKWQIPTLGKVRVRKLPKGALLHLRTSGVYIPHALEGHFDGGLYHKQWPFTMAHEMAHGYGFTEEAVCNFIAYLVCNATEIPELNYSAELAYWRYLASNVKSDSIVRLNRHLLEPEIVEDLSEIRKHILSYKEWMPQSRDVIYDTYLKSHRVSAGIKSYDQMIELVETWKYKNQ